MASGGWHAARTRRGMWAEPTGELSRRRLRSVSADITGRRSRSSDRVTVPSRSARRAHLLRGASFRRNDLTGVGTWVGRRKVRVMTYWPAVLKLMHASQEQRRSPAPYPEDRGAWHCGTRARRSRCDRFDRIAVTNTAHALTLKGEPSGQANWVANV